MEPYEPPIRTWYDRDKMVWIDMNGLADLVKGLGNQMNDVFKPNAEPAVRTLTDGVGHVAKDNRFLELKVLKDLQVDAGKRGVALLRLFLPGGMLALHDVAKAAGNNFTRADNMAANSMKSGADLWNSVMYPSSGSSTTTTGDPAIDAQAKADAEKIEKDLQGDTGSDTKDHRPDHYGGADGNNDGQVDVDKDDEGMGGETADPTSKVKK